MLVAFGNWSSAPRSAILMNLNSGCDLLDLYVVAAFAAVAGAARALVVGNPAAIAGLSTLTFVASLIQLDLTPVFVVCQLIPFSICVPSAVWRSKGQFAEMDFPDIRRVHARQRPDGLVALPAHAVCLMLTMPGKFEAV